MLSPDLPKAMEKSSPAPSTGADLPLSRKGSARSFRHWGGERMTRSSTFDDLVCDFLEEEDAKEEATAPLSSAPGSDNELKNGGDMLLGRTDSGLAESVLRSAMAQMSGAEMMRLDADAAAVSRSTTSSDSSASDPALEDGMSKLHEAVQNAAGAHPGVPALPTLGGSPADAAAAAAATQQLAAARLTARRLAATRQLAASYAVLRRDLNTLPSAPTLGSLGLGLPVQSYAASLTAAQQGAQNKPSSPFPAAAAPGAALDLSAGTLPVSSAVPLSSAMAQAIGQSQAMQQLAAAQHMGAVPRVDSHSPSPVRITSSPRLLPPMNPGPMNPVVGGGALVAAAPAAAGAAQGTLKALASRAADAANAAAAAAASAGGRAARQPVPYKGGQTMSAHTAAAAAAASAASQLIHAEAEVSSLARGGSKHRGVNRKPWSAEEDELIRSCVARLGERWRAIAPLVPGRSDDSVRNRWKRLREDGHAGPLGPGADDADGGDESDFDSENDDIDAPPRRRRRVASSAPVRRAPRAPSSGEDTHRVSWTSAEDQMIVRAVQELGPRWCAVASRLPSRTDQAVRNRWNRLQQRARVQARAAANQQAAERAFGASVAPMM